MCPFSPPFFVVCGLCFAFQLLTMPCLHHLLRNPNDPQSFMMAVRIMQSENVISPDEWRFFMTGSLGLESETTYNICSDWLAPKWFVFIFLLSIRHIVLFRCFLFLSNTVCLRVRLCVFVCVSVSLCSASVL
mgnify:FL=1